MWKQVELPTRYLVNDTSFSQVSFNYDPLSSHDTQFGGSEPELDGKEDWNRAEGTCRMEGNLFPPVGRCQ